MTLSVPKESRILIAILCLIIATGVSMAIYQYFLNRSLWLDEASLSLNIIRRDFAGLTHPLEYNQMAPVGFLFIEKIAVSVFGKNELALRLFPLLSFLLSVPFFYLLSKKLLNNPLPALLAVAILSISFLLISYASEVKQYSSDVLFTILILYSALVARQNTIKSLTLLAFIGGLAIWFSNISVIMLFVVGLYFSITEVLRNKNYKILIPFLFWAVSFLIYYFLFLYHHPSTAFMKEYWQGAFMPVNPFTASFYSFLLLALREIYGYLLGFGSYWYFPCLISLAGIGFMLKNREYRLLYFCIAPILLHLLLSGLKLYPFSGRLILYFIPLIVLIFSKGVYSLYELFHIKLFRLPSIVLALPAALMFYPLLPRFPVEKEEVKQSLKYIQSHIKENESLYVYSSSIKVFSFYKESQLIKLDNPIILGTSHRRENHYYDEELSSLKGKVWMLFSHVFKFGKDPENDTEEKYMVNFLLSRGSKIIDVKKFSGSTAYCIDTPSKLPESL